MAAYNSPVSAPSSAVSVIAAYRFVDIDDCEALQQRLLPAAQGAGLKGTVLLAPEGINIALAGERAALQTWLDLLCAEPRFAGLDVKWHAAVAAPFGRLRFRVKREIIRMNQPAVRPGAGRAPGVDAPTLARWLEAGRCDAGRPVVLLDTRNAFEVDAGAFEGAIDWRLHKFSDFPAALVQHAEDLQGKTVVSYCTGGIRCEKAALWMALQGLPHVRQLEGGILRYFEQTAGAPHWRGRCVVFDERGSVDTHLEKAG
ncbi:MAG: rhodanese-like domain-containing protein [Rubrivivax sp.]|nr:rhodanese-like domain-containing protein [Rubrivivax sp.]